MLPYPLHILAHRGLWQESYEKNTLAACEGAFREGYGVEVDIRDIGGQLMVAHDPNETNAYPFADLCHLIKRYPERCIAINIKSCGLQNLLKQILDKYQIKGYFEDTIQGKVPPEIPASERCAVAFIDCDLKASTAIALEFLRPFLQCGSVIILDDVFSYKDDPSLGVNGAWVEFLEKYPAIKTRPFFHYGCTGASSIVYAV